MSTPGQDNLSREQRRKLNRENQKATAAGNKTVQSASSSVEPPQLRSVNEPLGPQTPIMNKAELDLERFKTTKEIKDNQQQIRNDVDASIKEAGTKKLDIKTPQTLLSNEQIAENREKAKGKPQYLDYDNSKFNQAETEESVKNSTTFKDIVDLANKETQAAKDRADAKSHSAKMTSWGNLFNALGQLAGLGKNTYVKPNSNYLTNAMAKADEARQLYEGKKLAGEKAQKEYLNKAVAAERERFDNKQAAYNAYVKAQNEILRKDYKDEKDRELDLMKLNREWAFRAAELGIKQQTANAAAKNAEANQTRANAYSETQSGKKDNELSKSYFQPSIGGKTYYGDKATAGRFAAIMKRLGGWEYDIDTKSTDPTIFNKAAASFLEKYGRNPEVVSFITKNLKLGNNEVGKQIDLSGVLGNSK